jgi:hypothetical protein
MLFKNVDCDSITVPSCDDHNGEKSGADQAILSVFALELVESGSVNNAPKDVQSSVAHLKKAFKHVLRSAKAVNMPPEPEFVRRGSSIAATTQDHRSWIKCVSAGLIWDATQSFDQRIRWETVISWSPNFTPLRERPYNLESALRKMRSNALQIDELNSLPWYAGWSASPRPYPHDVYRFEANFDTSTLGFRHTFFNTYVYYVFVLDVTDDTLTKMQAKLEEHG